MRPFSPINEPVVDPRVRSDKVSVLSVDGPLREPLDGSLTQGVKTLLGQGERAIVVDLAQVPAIDAAGVGELVRAYNMTMAPSGALRIMRATAWVRKMLERAGLYELFSRDAGEGRYPPRTDHM